MSLAAGAGRLRPASAAPKRRPARGAPDRTGFWVGAALLVEFLLLARLRLVDADEGWELMAARLVAAGSRPYVDFFTQQMPLLPYVYAWWGRLAGTGWAGGRALSALMATASGILVYRIASRQTRNTRWGAVAAAAFGANALVFSWLPCIKTYALTTVLLLAAWDVLAAGPDRGWRWLAAGVCGGLAVSTRLFVVAALPALLLAGWDARRRWAGTLWFAAGTIASLLPVLPAWRTDPARLWYMNMGYHLTRSDLAPLVALKQKAAMALAVAGLGDGSGAAGTQVLILLVLAAALAWPSARRMPRMFVPAVALAFLSLLPTPTYGQYFCVAAPFLVAGVIELLAASGAVAGSTLVRVLAGAYLLAAPVEWHRVTHSGEGLPSVDRAPNWTLRTMARVGEAVDHEVAAPGEAVLSWWPGYLVASTATPVPGLENQFALSAGLRVDPALHAPWHVIAPPAIERMIRAGSPRVCVVGSWMLDMQRAPMRALLARSGYVPVTAIHDIEIWKHPARE